MSQTTIEHAIKEHLDSLFADNGEAATFYHTVLKRLKEGFYEEYWTAVIFQKFARHDIDIYDAFCFAQIWSAFIAGDLYTVKIHVGNEPKHDSAIADNNEILSKIAKPFKAQFVPSQSGSDGWLEWTEDIFLEKIIRAKDDYEGKNQKSELIRIEPQRIPLEVGSNSAQKAFEYVFDKGGAVARFPYNYKNIGILYLREELRGPYLRSQLFSSDLISDNKINETASKDWKFLKHQKTQKLF